MWTHFMDMHSGGSTKVKPYQHIFIEAPEAEAKVVFYNRFKRNPERVTCTCCGEDYSIREYADLAQATAYERGCDYTYIDSDGAEKTEDDWYALPRERRDELTGRYLERKARRFAYREYVALEDYMKRDDVLFIPASHIEPQDKRGDVPQEGFVWV